MQPATLQPVYIWLNPFLFLFDLQKKITSINNNFILIISEEPIRRKLEDFPDAVHGHRNKYKYTF